MTPQALVYLAVHLAFNVLRSPNHLHFEMLRARLNCTRTHARFACQAAQYTLHSAPASGVTQPKKIS